MNQREQAILRVTCFGHFVSHFNMLVFPAILLPLSGHLGMSLGDTLALSFFMYLLFGVSALPWGLLADKFGARALLAVFYGGAGGCGLLAALAMDNSVVLSWSLAGLGLFSGIYHPAGLGWIAKEVKKTSRGMGYNGMFGNLGLAAAPLIAGLVNYFWNIQAVYLVVGLVNISGLLLLIRTNKSNGEPSANHSPASSGNGRVAPFFILLIAMMLGGIVYRAVSVTLPAYFELSSQNLYHMLVDVTGLAGSPNVVATLLTSLIYLVGMAGQYAGGRLGEKIDLRLGYLLFHLITIPAAVVMAQVSNWPLVTFAMIHTFFQLGMQPMENTIVARLTPSRFHSSAYGMKFILTFGVGSLSVKMVEIIKAHAGLAQVYHSVAGISTLLVAVICLLISQTTSMKSND